MTITYSHKVSEVRLCGFTRLLCYWKGSIYKLLYKEMAFYVVFYTILTCVYRFALNDQQRGMFERLVLHFDAFTNLIPVSFILGFYVSIVLTRWWAQFTNIPWPDRVATYTATMIRGADEPTRILRRTMIRYLNLASVFVFQSISTPVKKRFPTMEHLVHAGLVTEKERVCFEAVESPHPKFWIPCMWCSSLAARAREEGKITDDVNLKAILDEIMAYRAGLGMLFSYDWISIPLVYTQVTTLAVYTYFFACLMGRQFLDTSKGYRGHDVDLYVPLFTMLQFFFYVGWIKVAEQLINPFGEDDDDFEVNWIIDRNVQVGLLIVDQMYMNTPALERDPYWGIVDPQLPYTKSALSSKLDAPFLGSTADLSLTTDDMRVVIHSTQTLEPIVEGKPFNDIPTSSPLKRKMFLDLNCPSPKMMSMENLLGERGRHLDAHAPYPHAIHDLVTPDQPLLNVAPVAEPSSPLVGRDWVQYHQDQYLKTLQCQDVDGSPNAKSVQNSDDTQLSSGERFLKNWLHGRPSVSDDIGIRKDNGSSHGAEIGVDLLRHSAVRNTGAGVLNEESLNDNCDNGNSGDHFINTNNETCREKQNLCVAEEKPHVNECSGNAYVESWLQVNQQLQQTTMKASSVGRKFEMIPVAEPLNTPKLRNVSFSETCSHIPSVEVVPDSVGVEMPDQPDDEGGRISGNSSYCTQSTVNSMKALLSSTD